MFLLKNIMKFIHNSLHIIEKVKIQDGCQILTKDSFWYQINWCAILISGLNLLRQRVLEATIYLHNKLWC